MRRRRSLVAYRVGLPAVHVEHLPRLVQAMHHGHAHHGANDAVYSGVLVGGHRRGVQPHAVHPRAAPHLGWAAGLPGPGLVGA